MYYKTSLLKLKIYHYSSNVRYLESLLSPHHTRLQILHLGIKINNKKVCRLENSASLQVTEKNGCSHLKVFIQVWPKVTCQPNPILYGWVQNFVEKNLMRVSWVSRSCRLIVWDGLFLKNVGNFWGGWEGTKSFNFAGLFSLFRSYYTR